MVLRRNPALGAAARAAMEDPANCCYVSHASAWEEVAIKPGLGKLKLGVDYGVLVSGVLEDNGFEFLAPTLKHFQALIGMPKHHGDPFDRLLIAQAKSEGLTIVSAYHHFCHYGMPLLW